MVAGAVLVSCVFFRYAGQRKRAARERRFERERAKALERAVKQRQRKKSDDDALKSRKKNKTVPPSGGQKKKKKKKKEQEKNDERPTMERRRTSKIKRASVNKARKKKKSDKKGKKKDNDKGKDKTPRSKGSKNKKNRKTEEKPRRRRSRANSVTTLNIGMSKVKRKRSASVIDLGMIDEEIEVLDLMGTSASARGPQVGDAFRASVRKGRSKRKRSIAKGRASHLKGAKRMIRLVSGNMPQALSALQNASLRKEGGKGAAVGGPATGRGSKGKSKRKHRRSSIACMDAMKEEAAAFERRKHEREHERERLQASLQGRKQKRRSRRNHTKEEKDEAATKIQKAARGKAGRRKAKRKRKKKKKKDKAATKIQSVHRGRMGRKKAARKKKASKKKGKKGKKGGPKRSRKAKSKTEPSRADTASPASMLADQLAAKPPAVDLFEVFPGTPQEHAGATRIQSMQRGVFSRAGMDAMREAEADAHAHLEHDLLEEQHRAEAALAKRIEQRRSRRDQQKKGPKKKQQQKKEKKKKKKTKKEKDTLDSSTLYEQREARVAQSAAYAEAIHLSESIAQQEAAETFEADKSLMQMEVEAENEWRKQHGQSNMGTSSF